MQACRTKNGPPPKAVPRTIHGNIAATAATCTLDHLCCIHSLPMLLSTERERGREPTGTAVLGPSVKLWLRPSSLGLPSTMLLSTKREGGREPTGMHGPVDVCSSLGLCKSESCLCFRHRTEHTSHDAPPPPPLLVYTPLLPLWVSCSV